MMAVPRTLESGEIHVFCCGVSVKSRRGAHYVLDHDVFHRKVCFRRDHAPHDDDVIYDDENDDDPHDDVPICVADA